MARDSAPVRPFRPGTTRIVFGEIKQDQPTVAKLERKVDKGKGKEVSPSAQSTLGSWLGAGWQPGMPVNIQQLQQQQQPRQEKKREAPTSKGSASSQSSIDAYLQPRQKQAGPSKSKVATRPKKTKRSNSTPPSSPDCYVVDSSLELSAAVSAGDSANATLGDAAVVDPDSSIEYLGRAASSKERYSPLTSALKHAALANAHILEHIRRRNGDEQTQVGKWAEITSKATRPAPPIATKRRPLAPASPSSSMLLSPLKHVSSEYLGSYQASAKTITGVAARPFSTTAPAEKENPGTQRPDWDDWDDIVPVHNAHSPPAKPLHHQSSSDSESDSSLPDIPNMGKLPVVPQASKGKTWQSTWHHKQSAPIAVVQPKPKASKPTASGSSKVVSNAEAPVAKAPASKNMISAAQKKEFTAEAKRMKREKQEQKAAEKAATAEEWKRKYRQFSYDMGAGATWDIQPKIWYFRGARRDGPAELVEVQGRRGQPPPAAKTLEEVVASLTGVLGYDMEWECQVWDARQKSWQYQGRSALIQLGDARNVVLYQLGEHRQIPTCIIDTLENGDIVKVGVQIGGDARKIHRDLATVGQNVQPRGLLELSSLAKLADKVRWDEHRRLVSMQALVAHFLEYYLDKGDTRTSKWEKRLSYDQRRYAANDVFVSVLLYRRMAAMAEEQAQADGAPLDWAELISDAVMGKNGLDLRIRKPPPKKVTHDAEGNLVEKPKSKSTATASGSATPRQMEAWSAWHIDSKQIPEIATAMGIKETSVAMHIVQGLARDESLEYDAERLKTAMAGVLFPSEKKLLVQILARSEGPMADGGKDEEAEFEGEEEAEEGGEDGAGEGGFEGDHTHDHDDDQAATESGNHSGYASQRG